MIYGITGLPGNGKTLYAIQFVRELAEKTGRPVFYHGINGLKLPWNRLVTRSETINGSQVDVPIWWDAPANAIVIIDEAQNCGFGVRPRGTVPEWARRLETHRHLGLDIVFITQSPMLLDSHDRALVGTHFHVVRNFGLARATIHEFQQLRDNVLKSRAGSIRHEWKYPKDIYALYTSAEAHTGKTRIPARVWVLLSIPFFIALVCWFLWVRWSARLEGTPAPGPSTAATTGGFLAAARPGGASSAPGSRPGDAPLTRAEYLAQFVARVPDLAYTAPAYDALTEPRQAPYPAACIASPTRCQCYTQQATHLPLSDELCRRIAGGGFFVAWQDDAQRARSPDPGQARSGVLVLDSGPSAVSLGGNPRAHILASGQAAPQAR